ncbi:MAG: hypothetical protein ASARMPREDX12_000463 [Alectoria sarmentosa]|nr:MAG: hypothetical protein ASARMPREDX12_000463 [Alectoria sarmentosa]
MSSNPTHPIVTANNFGPAVNVTTWFLGSTAVLFVIARLTTKVALAQRIRIDDGLLITALLFSSALVVAVSLETTSGGLGRHKSSLSQTKLAVFQKIWAAYAGDLLYILSLTFSKISLLALLKLLTPIAFWNYFGVFNIVTEGTLVMLPIVIIWNVQMPLGRKLIIVWCFAVRMFVVGAIVCELVFRNRNARSEDQTFAAWPVVICSQFVHTLSIITACIPYLKPFFSSLETGMIRTDDLRRLRSRSIGTYGYRKSTTPNKGFSGAMLRSIGSKKPRTWTDLPSHGDATNSAESADINGQVNRGSETESQTSQSRIIRQTAI